MTRLFSIFFWLDLVDIATVGVLLATDLFLVLELAHPYIGDTATSPEPLDAVIQVLSAPPA